MNNKILFDDKGEYCFLSNKYVQEYKAHDYKFLTVEQEFLFRKSIFFHDLETAELIKKEKETNRLSKLGRKIRNYDEKKWSKINYSILKKCIRNKFSSDKNLKDKLIRTYNKDLYSASPFESVLSIGTTKETGEFVDPSRFSGKNLLGKALMSIRLEFINEEKKKIIK